MIKKMDASVKTGKQRGGFGIEILYPGAAFSNPTDSGLAGIGRIDQARVNPGTLIPMHPHRNDEILTYIRTGRVKHTDSGGNTEIISSQRLMLMNAGAEFQHEEQVLEDSEAHTALQIFIRPEEGDMAPNVQFHDFTDIYSLDHWRKIAGKTQDFPLKFRSSTAVYDMRMQGETIKGLPQKALNNKSLTFLFYVFEGEVEVDDKILLKSGESLLIKEESPEFRAIKESDVVLFATEEKAQFFKNGMYSGNQK